MSGAVGSISVGWRDSTYRNHWYFTRERGALELDFGGDGRLVLHGARGARSLPLAGGGKLLTAQQAFVDRVRGKQGSGAAQSASGENGLCALSVALAAQRALTWNSSVRLQRAARKAS